MFASPGRMPNLAEAVSAANICVRLSCSEKNSLKNRLRQCWQNGKTIGHHLLRFLTLMLLVIGLCTVFDEMIGDGDLPQLNTIPGMSAQARTNSTASMSNRAAPLDYWQALKPTRELLTALSPEISAWLYQMHQENRLVYSVPAESHALFGIPTEMELLAAYRHINGKLHIGKTFWDLSDGEKATILIHEYRHYRQNPPKRISHQLAQLLGGGRLRYNSLIEDEAFTYERQAKTALGL